MMREHYHTFPKPSIGRRVVVAVFCNRMTFWTRVDLVADDPKLISMTLLLVSKTTL